MKKSLPILTLLLLFFSLAKSQSIGITGPATAASGADIVLTFTNENSGRFVSSPTINHLGSTLNTTKVIIGNSTFVGHTGPNPSKLTLKINFIGNQNTTTPETVKIRIDYSYNGSSGAGGPVTLYHTVSITPPPYIPPPAGPSSSQNKISFYPGATVSANNFSGTNWPLSNWLTGKTGYTITLQSSGASNFSSILRSRDLVAPNTFTQSDFLEFGQYTPTPFSQDIYVRMKLVWANQTFYSNILFIPLSPIIVPYPNGPTSEQNKLVLAAGSTANSFTITNPALAEFIQQNSLNSGDYTMIYHVFNDDGYHMQTLNRTTITKADFSPTFTKNIRVVVNFYYQGVGFWSDQIVVPL